MMLFFVYVCVNLVVKCVLKEYKFTRVGFDWVIGEIELCFKMVFVLFGDGIGMVVV